jgi:hypothetical protein
MVNTPPTPIKKMTIKLFLFLKLLKKLFVIGFNFLLQINRDQISPNQAEIELMREAYGDISIKSVGDLIRIQNRVLELNKHRFVDAGEFKLKTKLYQGLCFDRSIIFQKILIYNKISFRPIYLYHSGPTNTPLDLFSSKVKSHAVIEFKFGKNYYIMRTNSKMNHLQTLEMYLNVKNPYLLKGGTNVIYYLSNRNGRFIAPSYLPDIYYFNFEE